MKTRLLAVALLIIGGAVATTAPSATATTPGIRITAIYFNSPGSDSGSNSSLNAEWVRIKNFTSHRKALTGWTLRDASAHVYHFPTFHLAAGAAVKVHTGHGSNTAGNLYWRSSYYIWNNTGDTATLKNSAGTVIDRCSYSSAADPEALC
jgi:Lamin Tail Domain